MKLKYDIPSHSRLALSAIKPDPSQTPSELADTHVPLKLKKPVAQPIQSFGVPPVHVWHCEEHGKQEIPSLKSLVEQF